MNWVTIAVLAIMVLFGAYGWYKGILRIVLSLAATILTILVTVFVSPAVGNFIKENTDLYSKLETGVEHTITNNSSYEEAVSQTMSAEEQSEYINANGEISTYVEKIVDLLNLPASMESQVDTAVSPDTVNSLITSQTETVKDAVTHVIAERLANVIFNTIVYIIVFTIVIAVFRILISITGVIGRLPVIHQANKAGGLAVGLVEGLIVVWILFMVITLFSSSEWASTALADIKSNKILEFIYNNNLILKSTFRNL